MGTDSNIEWTDHTLNFWKGCTKVSAGCDHCYMYRDAKRYGWDPTIVTQCGKAIWRQPLVKNRDGSYKWKSGERVFVCSWSDFFHKDADQWRDEAMVVIAARPDLNWIITTKRIERAAEILSEGLRAGIFPNLTIMPTCENQEMADKRIPPALELKSAFPWVKIAVSIEPMLGEINLPLPHDKEFHAKHGPCTCEKLDGVIVGGESGPGARPMHPDWARSIRDQCVAAGVQFFFKQWGAWLSGDEKYKLRINTYQGYYPKRVTRIGKTTFFKVGRKKAGRLLDGRTWDELPDLAGK